MNRLSDVTVELTDAERVVKDWFNSLLDTGHSHASAIEQILLRTPVDGVTWKVLEDEEFRKYLAGIRFWGPLAKDEHKPGDEPVPRIFYVDPEGIMPEREAEVRRLGPDVWVVTDPETNAGHILDRKQIEAAPYLRIETCGASFVTGDYGTECDKDEGHPMPHEADDPMEMPGVRVSWEGGGSCAGDRLPYRNVAWTGR